MIIPMAVGIPSSGRLNVVTTNHNHSVLTTHPLNIRDATLDASKPKNFIFFL
jgi:hypothetical protein